MKNKNFVKKHFLALVVSPVSNSFKAKVQGKVEATLTKYVMEMRHLRGSF